jgi:hypothetical protein
VLCVLGKVGVGKSTFARHLGSRFRQLERLAADIFFGLALPDWSAEYVVRMILSHLCRAYPLLKQSVSVALALDSSPSTSLETRIRNLILEPIRSLRLPHPLVVVLDALDQWAPHPTFTRALSCLSTESHLIKLVIFARPGLEERLENVPFERYDLPNVSNSAMEEYFRERFNRVRWPYGRRPSAESIEKLVQRADGLFIWTSTFCSVLEDELSCPNPHDTIHATLQSQQRIGDNETLANLYHGVISLRFPKPDHKSKLKAFLGAVMVLQEPLPVSAFASLASMDATTVRAIQAMLRPLRIGRQPQGSLSQDTVQPVSSTFHFSFSEYLRSPDTPPNLAFSIDIISSHSRLGLVCLQELSRIVSSPELTFISPSQKYALRYWPIHIADGTPTVTPVSQVEWKTTPHFEVIDSISWPQWQHWATSYLQLVHPGAFYTVTDENLAQPPGLDYNGARRLPPPQLPRKTADEVLRASGQGTSQHPLSSVVKLLRQSQPNAISAGTIALAETAVRLQHQNSQAWLEMSTVCRYAAETSASNSLLERAVEACRYAAGTGGGENHERRLLAICLWNRFQRFGSSRDLEEAISLEREMLFLTPPGHPERLLSLTNLAASLNSHYDVTGSIASIEESTELDREALLLCPPGHPLRPISLNNLAASLRDQHHELGSTSSLEEFIELNREALLLCPPGHPHRSTCLTNLAVSLQSYEKVTGSTASLEECIELIREALLLWAPGHTDRLVSLGNLARCLWYHHGATGAMPSLEESIELNREALSLRPSGHPDRSLSVSNLADSLQSHHKVTGSSTSIEEAIVLCRELVLLHPLGHHCHPNASKTLAKALWTSYKSTGNIQHRDEANSMDPDGEET